MSEMYVDMHCLNMLQTGFTVTLSLGAAAAEALLIKQGITFTAWNYTDLLVDENGVLLISDYNIGIIAVDISNPEQPNFFGIYTLSGITMMEKVGQSLMLTRQFWNSPYLENHFEEYFTKLDYKNNLFWFDQNSAFLLDQTLLRGMHDARDYLIILQEDAMNLYRHSISKLLNPGLNPLQGFLTNGLIGMSRLDSPNQNLFIALFPYKIAIYNIDIMNITLQCQAPMEMQDGNYLLNFSVYSTVCPEMNSSVQNGTTFPACLYQIPAIAAIYDSGVTASTSSDKSGLIAGLVVGLFFGVVIIAACACYVVKISKKYNALVEKKGDQNINVGKGTVIGGYEDSEKQSNEPPREQFAPVIEGGTYNNNRLELVDNNNRA